MDSVHALVEALVDSRGAPNSFDLAQIVPTLARFGRDALVFARRHDVRVVPLHHAERYVRASPALTRMGVDVDAWPAPPAGLFVVEERSVYLRSRSPMTVAHEFGHALDCALGGGVYRSLRPMRLPGSTNISPSRCARLSKPTTRRRCGRPPRAIVCAASIRRCVPT